MTAVKGRLSTSGIAAPDDTTIQIKVDSVVEEWEEAVAWNPFLNAALAASTRTFDPPSPTYSRSNWTSVRGGLLRMDLEGGLIGIVGAPAISVSINNVAWMLAVPGTPGQYWLREQNAPLKTPVPRPYDGLEFLIAPWGPPDSIAVTGAWGFGNQVPNSVYEALLGRMVAKCAPEFASARAGGLAARRSGIEEERFSTAKDAGAWAYETGLWNAAYDREVDTFTRRPVGV